MIFLATHTFPRVFEVLTRSEGKKVTLPTLVSKTGLSENQIKGAIGHARRYNPIMEEQIEVVQPGRAWRFTNSVTPKTLEAVQEEIVQEVEMGSLHTWKHVFKVLRDNPGVVLTRDDIVERVEFPTPAGATSDADRVISAMATILGRSDLAPFIEVIQSSRSWRYKAPEKKVSGQPVSGSLKGSVLRYFSQRPGVTLFVNDIAEDLGFARRQVQNVIYNLRKDDSPVKDDFVVVTHGEAWQYLPNRAQVEAQTSNGHVTSVPEKAPALATPLAAKLTPVVHAPVPEFTSAYTPAAATTTLPVSSVVPIIPKVEPTPAPTPALAATSTLGGRLFEEIGQASDGSILIREAESKLVYRATEL